MKGYIYFIVIIVIALSCSDNESDDKGALNFEPIFITELITVDEDGDDDSYDVSQNVIQGIAAFEDGWFTTQTSAKKFLLINYLNENGNSIYNIKLDAVSHGQDLSLEIISDTELFLYTSRGNFDETRNTGMLRLIVSLPEKSNGIRDMSKINIVIDKEYDFNYTNSTPTINEDRSKFAIRSNTTILIHDKENVNSNEFNPLYYFELSKEQLIDNEGESMWFQGIVMEDNIVFCLTGNNSVTTDKAIFAYDEKGIVISKYIFNWEDFDLNVEEKFEPESLVIKNGQLYFAIMTKSFEKEGNIKYLYRLKVEY